MIVHGAGTNHWFQNDLSNRGFILLVALTGNVGKNEEVLTTTLGRNASGPSRVSSGWLSPEGRQKQRFQNTTLWSYVHSANRDPHLYNGKPIK